MSNHNVIRHNSATLDLWNCLRKIRSYKLKSTKSDCVSYKKIYPHQKNKFLFLDWFTLGIPKDIFFFIKFSVT